MSRQRIAIWAVAVLLAIRAVWLLHEVQLGLWPWG
jgi:hypothetical protein